MEVGGPHRGDPERRVDTRGDPSGPFTRLLCSSAGTIHVMNPSLIPQSTRFASDDDTLAWESFCRTGCILPGSAHVIAARLREQRETTGSL